MASMNELEPCPSVSGESTGVDLINNLNNDCLTKIFLNLPPGDKLNAEKVCKRWRAVAKVAWNDVKYLDFTKSTTNTTDFDKLPANYKNIHSIAKIILRCGRHLDGLKLGSPCHYSMIDFVLKRCQNLLKLEVSLNHDGQCFNVPKLKKLRYFCLEKMINGSDEGILWSLPYETLSELHLHGAEYGYALDKDYRPSFPFMSDCILQDLKNLTVMTLHNLDLGNNANEIINQNTNLTFLSLANSLTWEAFHLNLPNLEHLNLENVFTLDDDFIIPLLRTCKKLKYLNLNYCIKMTDEGITSLSELPQLEELSLNHLFAITDDVFAELRNLKRLSCKDCDNVGNDGVLDLIRSAPNLEYLNLIWTSVTHEVLIEANEISKQRTNGVSLRILVGSSVTRAWTENNDSPLLIVESTDDTTNPYDGPRGELRCDDVNDYYNPDYEFEYDYGSESEAEDDFMDWSNFFLDFYGQIPNRESDTSDSDD